MPIPITLTYPADQVQLNIPATSITRSEPPSPTPVVIPATPTLLPKAARQPTLRNSNGYSIPNEIYLQIITAALLPTSDLVTLLRVSRFFRFITCPILYPLIYTSVEAYVNWTFNLQFAQGVRLTLRTPPTPVLSRVLQRTIDRNGIQKETREVIFKAPLPNCFEYTTHLTLGEHTHSGCLSLTPFIMPNILTLNIRPATPGSQLSLCQSESGDNCCPLIANLRPRQLIVGGASTGFTGFTSGLWANSASCFPPPFVKHLVLILGIYAGANYEEDIAMSLLETLPSTLEKVSFVVSPAERGRWAICWTMRKLESGSNTLSEWEDRKLEASIMTGAALSKVKAVEIVGLEAVENAAIRSDYIDGVDLRGDMVSGVKAAMLARGHDQSEANARAHSITFTREEDFLPYNSIDESGAQWEEWNQELDEFVGEMVVALEMAEAGKKAGIEASVAEMKADIMKEQALKDEREREDTGAEDNCSCCGIDRQDCIDHHPTNRGNDSDDGYYDQYGEASRMGKKGGVCSKVRRLFGRR